MKYEYDFVRLRRKEFDLTSDEYREIIREHAAEGWRLVTIYAPGDFFGTPQQMDLIFERPLG